MSPACMNSNEAGSSEVKLSREDEGFDPEGENARVEIDMDNEPKSLLDSLNTWWEIVADPFKGIPGLFRHVELKLLDLLTSQLDHELISHNVTVEDLKKRMGGVFQKRRELLEATIELRQEKANLEVRLLSRL